MVDHLELQGALSKKCVHGHFEREVRLSVVALERALDRELSNVLLLNSLRVGLDLASLRELGKTGFAHARDFNILEQGVAGTFGVNSRKLHLLLICAEEDLHAVGPAPLRNGHLQLLHEQPDDFVHSLVNDELRRCVNFGLL